MNTHYQNLSLTDKERVELTKLEYQSLRIGQSVRLQDGTKIGRVWQLPPQGLLGYAIADSVDIPREITVLFRGSSMIPLDPESWTSEWLDTNLPVGRALMQGQHQIPQQLKTAAKWVGTLLKEAPQARLFIYGHSLGSINGQYAAIMCPDPSRLINAWLYEGSNVYRLLNDHERVLATQVKANIHQYIDPLDSLAIGYTDYSHVIGQLHYVDSLLIPRIAQHMWGGYRYDQGHLRLRMNDDLLVTYLQTINLEILSKHQLQIPADDSQVITSLRKLMARANLISKEFSR